ncbi:hypothetical protein FH972_026748 [Carpinus fangiana]|uniref:Uncharacterized protein n=1 Tax=Carpinus fangiana TaxID=176857 RepID=A0A5N6L7F1_9ROSI|nr:hypothetical protein FH972_026748 [Carpinus fangiana]
MSPRGVFGYPYSQLPRDGFFSVCDLGFQWSLQDGSFHPGGLFACVGQVGMGAFTPNPPDSRDNGGVKVQYADLCAKYMSSLEGFRIVGVWEGEEGVATKKKRNGGLQWWSSGMVRVSARERERERERGRGLGHGRAGHAEAAHRSASGAPGSLQLFFLILLIFFNLFNVHCLSPTSTLNNPKVPPLSLSLSL